MNSEERFVEAAETVAPVYPVVQKPKRFPCVVYEVVGEQALRFLAGPRRYSVTIAVDARAHTYKEAKETADKVIAAVRSRCLLLARGVAVDRYDEPLKLYRRVATLTVR